MARVGLIAGNGRFPFLVLDAASEMGHEIVVVAVKEEADADLEDAAHARGSACHRVSLGQLGKCLAIFKNARVTQVVMAGQVRHTKIFSSIVPDLTLLAVLLRLKAKNTDALISAIADVMRDRGIELLDSTAFLQPLLAREGSLSTRPPTGEEMADFAFGWDLSLIHI